MKTDRIIDWVLIASGSIYSLANIEHILGIAILTIQLAWIIAKLTVKIVNAIKNGQNLDDLDDDVSDTIDTIGDIKDIISKDEDNDNAE